MCLEVPDVEAAVPCDAGDGPAVTVLDPVGAADAEATVVVAGQMTSPAEARLPSASVDLGGWDGAGEAVCAGAVVESCDEFAGGREHQALAAGRLSAAQALRTWSRRCRVADVDAVVVEVEPEGGSVAGSQGEGGGGFGRVGEADDLLEAYGAGVLAMSRRTPPAATAASCRSSPMSRTRAPRSQRRR